MNKKCIINFGKGAWYPTGQKRLADSLRDTKFDGDLFAWNDEHDLAVAPHEMMPYQFKIGAFNIVANRGYNLILWCDAAVFAIKNVQPIFDYIQEHGHILFQSGFNCAQWTSDACLDKMGVTRDDAEKMTMYMACCMGLNLDHPRSKEFLNALTHYGMDGTCLPGDWRNDNRQVSQDPRCQGHRHDQSIGSIIAAKMGMDVIVGHQSYFAYYTNGVFQYGQQNNMDGIKDSVVMLSQGM